MAFRARAVRARARAPRGSLFSRRRDLKGRAGARDEAVTRRDACAIDAGRELQLRQEGPVRVDGRASESDPASSVLPLDEHRCPVETEWPDITAQLVGRPSRIEPHE